MQKFRETANSKLDISVNWTNSEQ